VCAGSAVGYLIDAGQKIFYKDCVDLTDMLDNVDIELTTEDCGRTWKITDCDIRSHRLTVRDISIPVEDWEDNRVTCYRSGGGCSKNSNDVTVIQFHNYGVQLDGKGNPIFDGTLDLNGHERFKTQRGAYFNYVHPSRYHTRTPADGINVYCFGLHPEQLNPSGSANLSRIDTTLLIFRIADPFRHYEGVPTLDLIRDTKLYVFAFSYNVLRVYSGMGGVTFSN